MIRSVAFTKEAYIGREVRIAARVSKEVRKLSATITKETKEKHKDEE